MTINARKLKDNEIPGKTELYELVHSREILAEEKQGDGSLDRVTLVYDMKEGDVGYFSKEFRPHNIQKNRSESHRYYGSNAESH